MTTAVSYLGLCVLALACCLSHQQPSFVPGSGVTNCNYALDIVFAIDGSDSMQLNNFRIEKEALASLVNSLDMNRYSINVGVVLFSSVAASYPLTSDKHGIVRNITALEYLGEGTRTDVAIKVATRMLVEWRQDDVRKMLIVITDGRSTYPARTLQAAIEAKRLGISIYAVGVTDAVNESELRQITTSPQSVFYSHNFQSLRPVLMQATNKACGIDRRGFTSECNTQLDLVIAIDSSNSMFEDNFNREKAAIANLVNNLVVSADDIHVGLVLFSGTVQFRPLSGNKQRVIRDINSFKYLDDVTRTDLAIQKASDLFINARGGDISKVLILVTDGRATFAQLALQAATNAKSRGIWIFTVGVTDSINQPELQSLASSPQHVLLSANFQTLHNDLAQLATVMCHSDFTTPIPTFAPVCNIQLDVIIAIDGSNSMFEDNFNVQKGAVKNLVQNLNVSPNNIHVGLVLYSGEVISLYLTGDKQAVLRAIDDFQYPDDVTRTDLAIQEARILFSNARGGNVKRLLIVITDGRATYPTRTIQAAQDARASQISISVVGVTDAINQQELQALASSPQQVFLSANFQSLQRDVMDATYQSCQNIVTLPPPVTPRTFCNDQLDLVVAIDGSNSMFQENFEVQKSSVINLIDSLNVGPVDVHVGLVLFSGQVSSQPLSGNRQQLITDINSFQYPDDSTRTDLAIQEASNLFINARGGHIQKLLLIITDGRATYPQETLQAAQRAKNSGISIYVVGVTDAINEQELQSLASNPQQVFFSQSFQNLQQDLLRATTKACRSG